MVSDFKAFMMYQKSKDIINITHMWTTVILSVKVIW